MGESPTPSRWWALTALIPLGLFVAAGAFVSGEYQTRLYFSGSSCRWIQAARQLDVDVCRGAVVAGDRADLDNIRTAFALDLAFAASFAIISFVLLGTGWRHWAPERRRTFGWWWALPFVAVAAGVLDLIETSAQLIWVGSLQPPVVMTRLVTSIAWWKWTAYIVALAGWFGLVLGPIAAPMLRPALRSGTSVIDRRLGQIDRGDTSGRNAPNASGLGICASGGGIRSASVMIGAFRGLSDRGIFQRAQWLHAVSGGGYAAGGWRVSSISQAETDGHEDSGRASESEENLFAPDHPWFEHVRSRRRYLDNGFGSLLGGIAGAMFRTVLVFGGVLAAAALVGWTVGRLTRSWAVHPDFNNGDLGATTLDELLAWRLILPGLIPFVCGVAAFLATRATNSDVFRQRAGAAARVLTMLGLALFTLLVAIPVGIRYGRPVLSSLGGWDAEGGAGMLALLSGIGVLAAVRQLLTTEFKKRWSRLGGVLLLLGLLLFAGKVADDQANLERFFRGAWVPIVAALWLLALEFPPAHRLTLNGVYRKRLADTFMPGVRYSEEPPWHAYAHANGPELVLCGTAHASRLQFGGLPALGFTFRPHGVTLHDGASAPWRCFPTGSWWDGFPRAWIVSRSMALTGAAFASAMGRQSFGSTNSLLAALNLRLGMWVPNPRHADWFVDPTTSPRVHLGYFAKELLNQYHPQRDAFVYVADGGHRENLGLVEQLRERPSETIVLDASGDAPGTFTTLKEAIELAGIELGVEIDIDVASVMPRPDDEAPDCVAAGIATHADGFVTRVIYAKAQISDTTPLALRQYAAAHPPYPNYSTGDQYLTKVEFDALVELGEHLAERVAAWRAAKPERIVTGK